MSEQNIIPSAPPLYPSLGENVGDYRLKKIIDCQKELENEISHYRRIMHLSMLSPRVGGGGGADPGEFDIFMEARVKFPTPRHLMNVKFPPHQGPEKDS